MTELAHAKCMDMPESPSALMASLREAGADRFDAVRWHYIEALAQRAMQHQGAVKRMLDAKLMQALTSFQDRFDSAKSDAKSVVDQTVQKFPHAAKELQQCFEAGDFKRMHRMIASLKPDDEGTSLTSLVRQLEQSNLDNANARTDGNAVQRVELKAIRNARNTWAKLSVDKEVTRALEQAPKNAGPINSHMLVLRSLEVMRDISPDYLNRFISYADTLLSLDQGEKEKPSLPKKPQATKAAKKS